MPFTSIKAFEFEQPKTVPSGFSTTLKLELVVTNGPRTLSFSAPAGYTVSPKSKTYDNGVHLTQLSLKVTGPKGLCFVEGQLDLSKNGDGVEVT